MLRGPRSSMAMLALLAGCGAAPAAARAPGRDAARTAAIVDRDADTVLADDRCPDDAEDLDGFEDADGCYDADDDADGRADADDLCPRDPEDVDSFEDDDGCPDPDNDQDRIADSADRCPNEAETYNGTADDDGCPDRGLVVITTHTPPPRERLYFASASARVTRLQRPILDAIAATLQHNPQIERVALVARTARGESPRLATQRALAVRDALVALGVATTRLELLALDDHATLGEKERDRSVELTVRRVDGRDVDDPLLRTARAIP